MFHICHLAGRRLFAIAPLQQLFATATVCLRLKTLRHPLVFLLAVSQARAAGPWESLTLGPSCMLVRLSEPEDLTLIAILAVFSLVMTLLFAWRHQKVRYFRLLVEKELAHHAVEQKYSRLFRIARDMILVVDENGRITEANDAACRAYGRAEPQLLSMTMAELCCPEARGEWENHWRGSEVCESFHLRADSSPFPVQSCSTRLDTGGTKLWLLVVRDVTIKKNATERLRRALAEANEAQQLAHLGTWLWKSDRGPIEWSEEMYRITGRDSGLPPPTDDEYRRLFVPGSWERLESAVQNALLTGAGYELDLELVRPDGTRAWVTARGQAERDASGKIVQLRRSLQDVSERKESENTLREMNTSLDLALDAAQMGAWDLDLQTGTVVRTLRHDMIFGYSSLQPAWNRSIFLQHLLPEDRERLESQFHLDSRSTAPRAAEFRILWPDGSIHWVADKCRFHFDPSGKPVRMSGVIQDITARKCAEEELRKSEERFRSLVEHSNDWIWEVNAEGRLTYSSPMIRRYLGYDPDETLGASLLDFVPPGERRLARKNVAALRKVARDFSGFALTFTAKDGRLVAFEINGAFIFDAAGSISGVRGVARDVTERNRAQEALRESDRKYRLVVSHIPDVVWSMDDRKHFALVTENVEELVGHTAGEFYRHGPALWFSCIHPDDRPRVSRRFDSVFASTGEYQDEYRVRGKDGQWIWIQAHTLTFEDRGRPIPMGLFTNITERKNAADALKASEEKYRVLCESIPDVVWTLNSELQFLFIGDNIERMSGYTPAEIYSQGAGLLLSCLDPNHMSMVKESLTELFASGKAHDVECRIRRKDGEWIWIRDRAVTTYERSGLRYAQGLTTEITSRKRAADEVANSNRQLRRLAGQLLKAQDSERRRLARELHDSTAQLTAAIVMNLTRLRTLEPGPSRQGLIDESLDLARQCGTELRTISYGLHPPLLDEVGLAAAVRTFAGGFESRSGLSIETNVSLGSERLDRDMELAIFRIIQEAIVNVHRHSGSRRAQITLQRDESLVRLTVRDFGASSESTAQQGFEFGVGIPGMRERAAQFGGKFDLTSTSGGTTLTVSFPVSGLP